MEVGGRTGDQERLDSPTTSLEDRSNVGSQPLGTEKARNWILPQSFEGTRKELSTVDPMILSQWNLCQPFNHKSIR